MYSVTKKVWAILDSRQKRKVLLIGVLMLLGGMMESLSISLVLPLITAVVDSNWNTKWYAKIICSILGIEEQTTYIKAMIISLVVIFIVKNIYLLLEYKIQNSFVTSCRYSMQKRLLNSYLQKPYHFFLDANSGEILRILSMDTSQAFQALSNILLFSTEGVISLILGITILLMSPFIAIMLFILLALEIIAINVVIKPITKRMGETHRRENAISNEWIIESINGIKSIKVSRKENFFEKMYAIHARVTAVIEGKYLTYSSLPRLIIEAFTVSGVLVIILIMVILGTNLIDIIPELSAFVVAAIRLLPSVNRMSTAINQVSFLEGGINNVLLLSKESNKNQNSIETTQKDRITFISEIYMRDVSFRYGNRNEMILERICLKIKKGEAVGIIGPSGSGKTTLVDILLGLLKPTEGEIFVDGINIEEDINGWLESVAYIPQQIFLMSGTIRENIAFGMEQVEIDEDLVWNVLKDAQLYEFVKGLPEQLDTQVGEGGIRLSGGQRQRIGIARALYYKPEILFLDEATSALDTDTEKMIMDAIDRLKGRITLVIIAHRLSTIKECDVVYKLSNAKIEVQKKDQI